MKSSITLSLVAEVRGGPFVYWDDLELACRHAADLGFEALEIFPPSPEALHDLKVAWALRKYGLKLAALGTGAGWVKRRLSLSDPAEDKRREAVQFVRRMIDLAGDHQSQVIVGSMQGKAEGSTPRRKRCGCWRLHSANWRTTRAPGG